MSSKEKHDDGTDRKVPGKVCVFTNLRRDEYVLCLRAAAFEGLGLSAFIAQAAIGVAAELQSQVPEAVFNDVLKQTEEQTFESDNVPLSERQSVGAAGGSTRVPLKGGHYA